MLVKEAAFEIRLKLFYLDIKHIEKCIINISYQKMIFLIVFKSKTENLWRIFLKVLNQNKRNFLHKLCREEWFI